MKEISVYIVGELPKKSKHSVFYLALYFNEHARHIKGIVPNKTVENTVLLGILTAVEKLTLPCIVNVFTSGKLRHDSIIMHHILSLIKTKKSTIVFHEGHSKKSMREKAIKPAS